MSSVKGIGKVKRTGGSNRRDTLRPNVERVASITNERHPPAATTKDITIAISSSIDTTAANGDTGNTSANTTATTAVLTSA